MTPLDLSPSRGVKMLLALATCLFMGGCTAMVIAALAQPVDDPEKLKRGTKTYEEYTKDKRDREVHQAVTKKDESKNPD